MNLKNIYTLLLLLGCLFVATACSEDDEGTAAVTLKVIKSDVKFGAAAATGTIEVSSAGTISAVASEDWCTVSVSGNIVTVNVTVLDDRESRSALVTITDVSGQVEVPVYQSGIVWSLKGKDSYITSYKEARFTIPAKIDCEYTATPSASWITGELTKEGYVVTLAENSGAARGGTLTFKSILGEKVYTFVQIASADFAGTYTALYQTYYDSDEDGENDKLGWFEQKNIKLTASEDNENLFFIENLSSLRGLKIPLTFDEESCSFTMPNATHLADIELDGNTYYLYALTLAAKSSEFYINYSIAYTIMFAAGWDVKNNKPTLSIADTGAWSGYQQIGFNIQLFSSKTLNSTSNMGYWDSYYYYSMTKN